MFHWFPLVSAVSKGPLQRVKSHKLEKGSTWTNSVISNFVFYFLDLEVSKFILINILPILPVHIGYFYRLLSIQWYSAFSPFKAKHLYNSIMLLQWCSGKKAVRTDWERSLITFKSGDSTVVHHWWPWELKTFKCITQMSLHLRSRVLFLPR